MLIRMTALRFVPLKRSFVAGVVVKQGVAVRRAPIVNYMHGWTAQRTPAPTAKQVRVEQHCRRKGWQCEQLSEGKPDDQHSKHRHRC